MSENLKRAESLFNRIMNQNGNATISSSPKQSINSADSNGSITSKSNYHHSHHSYHPHHKSYKSYKSSHGSSNVNLPRNDPVKISKEVLSEIPENHHVLPYCWTVWHHSRLRLKKDEPEESVENNNQNAAAVDSYLQTTNEIEFSVVGNPSKTTKNIGSVEQLWMGLSTIKKTYELPIGTEFLIFKSGINPVWEDPINAKGGRWVFRFNRRSNNNEPTESGLKIRQRTSLIWERLVLKTITGSIIPDANYSEEIQDLLLNDISGLVLSVRKDEDIISIWNSNLNFNKKKDESKKLTSFQARRVICDSILRIIRECDLISQGSDCIVTLDSGSNERVYGVSFEYRLHADNSNPTVSNEKYTNRRYKLYHHNKLEAET